MCIGSIWGTENHFRAMTATGDVKQKLEILDRLLEMTVVIGFSKYVP